MIFQNSIIFINNIYFINLLKMNAENEHVEVVYDENNEPESHLK